MRTIFGKAIPNDLTLGEHTIEVKATDRYGKKYTQTKIVKVQEPVALNSLHFSQPQMTDVHRYNAKKLSVLIRVICGQKIISHSPKHVDIGLSQGSSFFEL